MTSLIPRTGWKALGSVAPVALTALVLAMPAAVAGTVAPSTTLTAPYRVVSITSLDSTLTNGTCTRAGNPFPAQFHPRSGLGMFSLAASAASCGSSDEAVATGGLEVDFALGHPPSGTVTVAVNWTLNGTASLAFTPGTCTPPTTQPTPCYGHAYYTFGGVEWGLYDLTLNGSQVGTAFPFGPTAYNGSWRSIECSAGSCTTEYSVNGTGTTSIHQHGSQHFSVSGLNTSHLYEIVFLVGGSAQVWFQGPYVGAKASVKVTTASPGLDIHWIYVT